MGECNMRDLAYLQLLAREYPSVKEATSEIVNLMAICSLPKGTEYFFSDLHGEYEAFIHLLRSSSGIIREKIKETFGHLIPVTVSKSDLLSRASSSKDDESWTVYRRLAEDHHLQTG